MPLALLIVGVVCATATLVSLRPPMRPGVVALLFWPVGWLVGELPLHQIAMQLAGGVMLASLGGLEAPVGWIGAGLLLLSILGLRQHLVLAAHTTHAVEQGLAGALGRDYHDRIDPALRAVYDPTISWLRLAAVWPFHPSHVRRTRNLEYHRDGRLALRLDVYRGPELDGLTGPRPVFVYVHGGGWVIGNKGQQGRLTAHELAAGGWVVVSINYRLSPRATFPDHLIDVKRALAWVKANIAEHGGDPRFVVIGGGSAGAHLASLAALTGNDPRFQPGFADADTRVQGCVAYYGIYDFVDRHRSFRHQGFQDQLLAWLVMKAPLGKARDAYELASPIVHVRKDAPPFLLLHGDRDSLAPLAGAHHFRAALAAVSEAPVAMIELPGAQHAFELFPSLRSVVAVHGVHRFCQAIWCAWRRAAESPQVP